MSRSRAIGLACLVASMPSIPPAAALAQQQTAPEQAAAGSTTRPAGWLPPDHWSRHALDQLVAAVLLPADAASLAWPASRAIVRSLFVHADSAAIVACETNVSGAAAAPAPKADRPQACAGDGADLPVSAWIYRLDNERRHHSEGAFAFAMTASGGFSAAEGTLLAGTTVTEPAGPSYPGPTRVNDRSGMFGEIGLTVRFGKALFVEAIAHATRDEDVRWPRLAGGSRFGPVELWFGRREAAFGPSGGGLTLSGAVPFDGGGFDLPEGLVLPGFLRGLGRFRVNQVVARFERSGAISHPWFVATRLSFAPSDRLAIGINRAALFGGEGNEPVTFGRVVLAAIGITDSRSKDSDFENQVASIDVAWSAGRSMLVWAEYGFDDAGTAFVLVPAVGVGILWTALDWAPALSLGGSVTGISSSCCGHPAWYVHAALSDGWTDRGRLLGHRLGGNGLELGLDWAVDPSTVPVIARGRVYYRDRGSENLFSPARHGRTGGIEARVETLLDRLILDARIASEVGAGPDLWSIRLAVSAAL
jgi:hypothetical protein